MAHWKTLGPLEVYNKTTNHFTCFVSSKGREEGDVTMMWVCVKSRRQDRGGGGLLHLERQTESMPGRAYFILSITRIQWRFTVC